MGERTQLILAHLDLTRLTDDFFGHRHLLSITYCDLSFNRFDDIQALIQLSNLEVLILDSNDINDNILVQQLPLLPRLHTLSLNKNCLTDVGRVLRHLQRCTPALRHLSTLSNPMCCSPMTNSDCDFEDYQRYRYQVLFHLPELQFLDSTPVKDSERVTAQRTGKYLRPIRIDVARQARSPDYPQQAGSSSRSNHNNFNYNNPTRFGKQNGSDGTVTMDSLLHSPLVPQQLATPIRLPSSTSNKFNDDVDNGSALRRNTSNIETSSSSSSSAVHNSSETPDASSPSQVSFGTLKYKYVGVRSEGNRFIKDENL